MTATDGQTNWIKFNPFVCLSQVRVAGRFGGKKVNSLANLDDGQIIGLLPTPHSGIWNIVNRNFVDLIIDHGRRPPPLLSAPILGAVAHRE